MDQIVTGKSYIDASVATLCGDNQVAANPDTLRGNQKGSTGAMEGACHNRRRPRKGRQIGRI